MPVREAKTPILQWRHACAAAPCAPGINVGPRAPRADLTEMGVFTSRAKPPHERHHSNIDLPGVRGARAALTSGWAFLLPAPVADGTCYLAPQSGPCCAPDTAGHGDARGEDTWNAQLEDN